MRGLWPGAIHPRPPYSTLSAVLNSSPGEVVFMKLERQNERLSGCLFELLTHYWPCCIMDPLNKLPSHEIEPLNHFDPSDRRGPPVGQEVTLTCPLRLRSDELTTKGQQRRRERRSDKVERTYQTRDLTYCHLSVRPFIVLQLPYHRPQPRGQRHKISCFFRHHLSGRLDCLSAGYFLLADFQPSTTKTREPLIVFLFFLSAVNTTHRLVALDIAYLLRSRQETPRSNQNKNDLAFLWTQQEDDKVMVPSTSVRPHTLSRSHTPVHTSL